MTAIIDLSNEPKFTIKVVSSQTGIRPVTLRAWERRHEMLNPHRSDNHYRLYSERDVAILRWLKYRVDEGMTISSAVSELRSMTSNNVWPEAIPLIPGQPLGFRSVTAGGYYARQLSQALMRHDETQASELLRDVHGRLPLMTVIVEVLIPTVSQVEEAWYRGEISFLIKRFANSFLRGKLLSLFQAYPSRHNAPLVFIGCAPMEVNELNSLMMAVLLRSQGYRVDYLGPDVNIEDLADYASYEMPALVVLWANSEFTAREMRPLQRMLKRVRSMPVLGFTGDAFQMTSPLSRDIPGVYLGDTFEATLEKIKDLMKTPHKGTRRAEKMLVQ